MSTQNHHIANLAARRTIPTRLRMQLPVVLHQDLPSRRNHLSQTKLQLQYLLHHPLQPHQELENRLLAQLLRKLSQLPAVVADFEAEVLEARVAAAVAEGGAQRQDRLFPPDQSQRTSRLRRYHWLSRQRLGSRSCSVHIAKLPQPRKALSLKWRNAV